AVDILEEKLRERGAEVVMKGLKVELTPEDEDVEKCLQFGSEFVKHLS
ncbi:flavodoxin, partial [Bacillus cereus]